MRINLYFTGLNFRDSFGLIFHAFINFFDFKRRSTHFADKFINLFNKKINTVFSIVVPSNRSGLYLLFHALNISENDEVIVTGFTCSAVIEPIILIGAKPIYIDIKLDHFCMDEDILESKITSNTKILILQHTFGMRPNINNIISIAKKYNLFVIEDCALALGSKFNNNWLGTTADASIWSFELSKTISVGWGGLLSINYDKNLALKIQNTFSNHKFNRFESSRRLFQAGLSGILYNEKTPDFISNYTLAILFKINFFKKSSDYSPSDMRMPSDYQWKYLIKQFINLDLNLNLSQIYQSHYEQILNKHNCWYPTIINNQIDSVLIRFPFLVQNPINFVKYFEDRNIEIGRWFSKPVSSNSPNLEKYFYESGTCKISEYSCKHIVNLPLHKRLTLEDIEKISSHLDEYLSINAEEVIFMRGLWNKMKYNV
jgi:dTDP-4-amino-4,6-dideoxygalactose transaminase